MSQQYDEAPAETQELNDPAVDPSPDGTTGDAPIDVAPEETLSEPVTEPVTEPGELPEDPATGEATDEPGVDEPAVDPLEEFRESLRTKPGDWFVVHTYSGMENRVKANLENRTTSLNMEDYIHEIVVPTEEVAEIKNGDRKSVV